MSKSVVSMQTIQLLAWDKSYGNSHMLESHQSSYDLFGFSVYLIGTFDIPPRKEIRDKETIWREKGRDVSPERIS